MFADENQIYGYCAPAEAAALQNRMSACKPFQTGFAPTGSMQVNASKTEFICFATARRRHQLPANPVCMGNEFAMLASSVRNLHGHSSGFGTFYEQSHCQSRHRLFWRSAMNFFRVIFTWNLSRSFCPVEGPYKG
jgi:hypothetical protein